MITMRGKKEAGRKADQKVPCSIHRVGREILLLSGRGSNCFGVGREVGITGCLDI